MRLVMCVWALVWLHAGALAAGDSYRQRVARVTSMPGLVAFWDFTKREAPGGRFTAYVPAGATDDYPLDAGNYVKDLWNAGPDATYDDFPLLGAGPFGEALRIRAETNPDFRPLLFIPRVRLHDTPLDIKGPHRSVTVVVWAVRESGSHALAGIWHEGTDLKMQATETVAKVERGQRQYALFAGLNHEGSACGHLSENGAGSFLNKYALHKCHSAEASPTIPAEAPSEVLERSWQTFAMTFDAATGALTGWLDGRSGDRWLENPKKNRLMSYVANAWLQGRLARIPGRQPGEDPEFPVDQHYNPPEDTPVGITLLEEKGSERVELREYPYTKVKVTLRDGRETDWELVALRLNPWFFPHAIYTPKNAGTGGPFTIGRVIHSHRTVGFTGWIGGVAVFDRALSAAELARLHALAAAPPEGAE